MRINLSLYDVDGCLYSLYRDHSLANQPIEELFYEKNKIHFFTPLIKKLREEKYDGVINALGTNRQSMHLDKINWKVHNSASCVPVLPMIQSILSQSLPCPVVFDPFVMADIYGQNLSAGESYLKMLKEYYSSHDDEISHAQTMFDDYKGSLLYAHLHRVANFFDPSDEIVVDFYDDRKDILAILHRFFTKKPSLMPKNVRLRLHHYDGTADFSPYEKEIQGTGDCDKQYDWSIRYICSQTYYGQLSDNNWCGIETAEKLQEFHDKNIYPTLGFPCGNKGMKGSSIKINKFLPFRKDQISQLCSNSKIVKDPCYHTVDDAVMRELIPEKYNIKLPLSQNLMEFLKNPEPSHTQKLCTFLAPSLDQIANIETCLEHQKCIIMSIAPNTV